MAGADQQGPGGGHPVYADDTGIIRVEISDRGEGARAAERRRPGAGAAGARAGVAVLSVRNRSSGHIEQGRRPVAARAAVHP
ncbi:DUF6296 family protein [Streptomyces lavendulae]|uniref:DUF6296 family protein n=1 Tax=Streptomyces lavendulae TaxID=1914 RepID=UPI0033F72454